MALSTSAQDVLNEFIPLSDESTIPSMRRLLNRPES